MKKYFETILSSETGLPISGVQIYVRNSSNALATLYADDGSTPTGNPVTTDDLGRYEFYVADGNYRLEPYVNGSPAGDAITDIEIISAENLPRSTATRDAMAALNGATVRAVIVVESGHEGTWIWSSANLSAQVTADPTRITYVAPLSDPTGATGAWVKNADTLDADLSASSGSSLIGFLQSGTGAVARTMQAKAREIVSVKDFGATGDGVTDDTAAIQSAIDLFTFPAGTPSASTCGGTIIFPRGVYIVDDLVIENVASTNNGGLNGLRLIGDNAVLKGKAAATKILSVKTDDTAENISGIDLDGLQFDLTAMTTTGITTCGLYVANAYLCSFKNLHFYGGPTDNTHIQLDHTGSKLLFQDVHAARIRIEGDDYGVAQLVLTTTNFWGCSWVDLLIDKAWGLNFWGCVAENPADAAFTLSNCDAINIIGGDYEGVGGVYLDASGGNVSRVYSMGNRTASLTSYSVGEFIDSQLLDRWSGPRVSAHSLGRGAVGTSATEIHNFAGDPTVTGSSYTAAEFTVYGDNGSAGFVDKVAVAFGGVVVVLSSNTAYGSPAARTYTFSAPGSFKLAMASGSYQVKAVATSSPYS